MPRVIVKFFAHTAEIAEHRELHLEVSHDLQVALGEIEAYLGGVQLRSRLGAGFALLHNGKSVRPGEQEYELQEGDHLAFVPMLGAG